MSLEPPAISSDTGAAFGSYDFADNARIVVAESAVNFATAVIKALTA